MAEPLRVPKVDRCTDLQIAATALHHDLELVTGHVRHFERIPDLRLNASGRLSRLVLDQLVMAITDLAHISTAFSAV
jgi:hypothetical protein